MTMKQVNVDGILLELVDQDGEKVVDFRGVTFDKSKSQLKQMYEWIDCDCVDHATLVVDQFKFACWVDDEGILKGKPAIIQIPPYGQTLHGNVLITALDETGEIRPLTPEELFVLEMNLVM